MRTQRTSRPRIADYLQLIPTLLVAMLVVGGCSATHVGDAWQCPLAQGAACTSVADADPAAASSGKAQGLPTLGPLLWAKARDVGEGRTSCGEPCDPLAWLAEWLGIPEELGDGAAIGELEAAPPDEGTSDPSSDGLRTKEKIARIWIAPFVDSGGVYREAHWVRTVLEPARWRLR
ncbi:MAG: TraV family lipoprotein [Deltaproteobacteria bacterium]|nr:TraV family lipoprotein [Deltaproteobacteria bacterium]